MIVLLLHSLMMLMMAMMMMTMMMTVIVMIDADEGDVGYTLWRDGRLYLNPLLNLYFAFTRY